MLMLYQRFARPVTGKPAIPSRPLLDHIKTLCEDGNLQQTRELLTNDIHRLTKDDLVTLCQCSISKYETARRCVNIPCDTLLYYELATLACECNQVDIFEYLWETYSAPRCWGVSGRWTLSAAVNASSRLYESLLAKDPEIIGDIEERGPTSISAALDCGELEFIDCMLSKGVDINLGFPTGNPLETAALADTDETAMQQTRFCIERGATVRGSGALRYAAAEGRLELVRYLYTHEADIDDVDADYHNRGSSLTEASIEGHADVVDFLLKHGANTRFLDHRGDTLLMLAKTAKYKKVIDLLQKYEDQQSTI